MPLSVLWKKFPPRLRQLFTGGPELVFDSRLPPSALIAGFRATFQPRLSFRSGACGWICGLKIHIGWTSGFTSDAFAPVFHGSLAETESGTRISGRIAVSRPTQAFMSVWCGGIILFSIASIWTIIFPLFGLGLLWCAEGMIRLGGTLQPGQQQKILDYISRTCGPPTEEPVPGAIAPVT